MRSRNTSQAMIAQERKRYVANILSFSHAQCVSCAYHVRSARRRNRNTKTQKQGHEGGMYALTRSRFSSFMSLWYRHSTPRPAARPWLTARMTRATRYDGMRFIVLALAFDWSFLDSLTEYLFWCQRIPKTELAQGGGETTVSKPSQLFELIVNSTAPGLPKDSSSKDSTSKAETAKESDSEDEAQRCVFVRMALRKFPYLQCCSAERAEKKRLAKEAKKQAKLKEKLEQKRKEAEERKKQEEQKRVCACC